jgi:hypothetical protein
MKINIKQSEVEYVLEELHLGIHSGVRKSNSSRTITRLREI